MWTENCGLSLLQAGFHAALKIEKEVLLMKILKCVLVVLSAMIIVGCGSSGTSGVSNTPVEIESLANQMTEVIPAHSGSDPQANLRFNVAWPEKEDSTYIFNIFSLDLEEGQDPSMSIYYGPDILDTVSDAISKHRVLSERDLINQTTGSQRITIDGQGEFVVSWEPAPNSVSLPSILGKSPVTDFQLLIEVESLIPEDIEEELTNKIYYRRDASGEKMLSLREQQGDNPEAAFVYAERSSSREGLKKAWSGYITLDPEKDSSGLMYVEFDHEQFRVKWVRGDERFFGGGLAVNDDDGELIEDESMVAIRLVDSNLDIYDIITYEDAKDVNTTPDAQDPEDFPAEDSDEYEEVQKFIDYNSSYCLFANEAALESFVSPTSASQVRINTD